MNQALSEKGINIANGLFFNGRRHLGMNERGCPEFSSFEALAAHTFHRELEY
ncbi:hypothetical protein [Cryobacterium sp. TMT3-29-2]|uniref:hypothetical protein n=1 Tax=Cryobacterium sp. TMT3-29-2 TaxID=2555867 RepID=UPI001431E283|nr:hypothetical protein [Cryobacterium sp. TMT3-29-2]